MLWNPTKWSVSIFCSHCIILSANSILIRDSQPMAVGYLLLASKVLLLLEIKFYELSRKHQRLFFCFIWLKKEDGKKKKNSQLIFCQTSIFDILHALLAFLCVWISGFITQIKPNQFRCCQLGRYLMRNSK